eukprot:IDg19166t1
MCTKRARSEDDVESVGDNSGKGDGRDNEEVKLELVEGYLENAQVKPRLDIDADERMLMIRLRRSLHKDDFDRIFNKRDRRIGDL